MPLPKPWSRAPERPYQGAASASAGRVDWSLGLPLAAGGLFTVSAGVALAHRLPERRMRAAFAGLQLITAAWLLLGSPMARS